jgi:hypothetical protein
VEGPAVSFPVQFLTGSVRKPTPSENQFEPAVQIFPSLSNHTLPLHDMDVAIGSKIGQFLDLLARGWPVNFQFIDLGRGSNPQHFAGIV